MTNLSHLSGIATFPAGTDAERRAALTAHVRQLEAQHALAVERGWREAADLAIDLGIERARLARYA